MCHDRTRSYYPFVVTHSQIDPSSDFEAKVSFLGIYIFKNFLEHVVI